MNKRLTSLIFVISFLMLAMTAYAAPKDFNVIILPIEINAEERYNNLKLELPLMIGEQFRAKGVNVLSNKAMLDLVKRQGVSSIDTATARKLAKSAGRQAAVFGSLTQVGDSFSLDLKLVDANGSADAKPYFSKEDGMISLLPAVGNLVGLMVADVTPKSGITEIRVDGTRVLDPDVILARVDVEKGDNVSAMQLNDEIKKIWDLGYFSDVQAKVENSGQGSVLVFTVVEKPRIEDVRVNGSDAVDTDDIIAAMSSKTGSVVNEELLAQDVQKVRDLYLKEGFHQVTVDARVEERDNGTSAALVFDVREGNVLYIKDVKIVGLSSIDEDEIKDTLALTSRNLLSWVTGTGVLRDEHLERDTQAITAYLLNRGYIDAQVARPEVIVEDDGLTVQFEVKEGTRYNVGNVAFTGELIDDEAKLRQLIDIDNHKDEEQYFSLTVMQDDIKKLTNLYSKNGYAFAAVDVQTPKNDENATIDVIYSVNKKNKVYVRRVDIEGNLKTRDNVIIRELRIADGDEFDGEALARSNERLARLRYFTQADVLVQPTDNPDEVDLKVKVEEDRTGAIMGGVGYSTAYDFGVSASINERNLFGRGYSLNLAGFVSGNSSDIDLTFTNPRLYDTNLGFTYSAYAIWEEWDDFSKRTVGNTFSFFYPLGEYTTVSAGYRFDFYNLHDIESNVPRAYREYLGDNISSVIHANLIYDSTDSNTYPTDGYIAKLFLEYGGGGLGGNDNFFRPIFELQGFHELFNKDHIFHWKGRVGGVFENSSKTVPVFDRFFLGGMDSIRGYSQDDLAPRDKNYPEDQIGADRIGFINLEYIWRVNEEYGISLVPFFDAGFTVDSAQTDDYFGNIKKSVGLELRWSSPMGDLRFAYGFPLDENIHGERRKSGRFEFSMGQYF